MGKKMLSQLKLIVDSYEQPREKPTDYHKKSGEDCKKILILKSTNSPPVG